jgi:hypothetical protein
MKPSLGTIRCKGPFTQKTETSVNDFVSTISSVVTSWMVRRVNEFSHCYPLISPLLPPLDSVSLWMLCLLHVAQAWYTEGTQYILVWAWLGLPRLKQVTLELGVDSGPVSQ